MSTKHPILLHRHPTNPILHPDQWPYPIHTVFNPGAAKLPDGSTALLCRCEDRRGLSHFCCARSPDGISDWVIDPQPAMIPDPEGHPEELWGIEDPRITYVPEEEIYFITYTAYGRSGPGVSLATTKDFKTFERKGMILAPEDKDAALLPRRFKGEYLVIHRPATDQGSHIYVSYSNDLMHFGQRQLLLPARAGAWWDANKIGLSPPLVETPRGWLMLYHGVRTHASGSIYRVGLALFDLDDPCVLLARSQSWMFGPEERYETEGDVPHVVFPCGALVGEDGDTLRIYYGAADSSIGLATGSVNELVNWVLEEAAHEVPIPATPQDVAGRGTI